MNRLTRYRSDIEKLGWKVVENNKNWLKFKSMEHEIYICKPTEDYCCDWIYKSEHKLLNELFQIWGGFKMENKYQEALDVINQSDDEKFIKDSRAYFDKYKINPVSVIQELVDEKTPKKAIYKFIKKPYEHIWSCPKCKEKIRSIIYQDTEEDTGELNYCPECGQRIDWSDKDE